MPAKKAINAADAYASFYEGKFEIYFTCPGELLCKYALCYTMPPTGEDECVRKDHGTCLCPLAKQEATRKLRDWLTRELKDMEAADAAG